MLKKIVVGVLALCIFAGIGYLLLDSSTRSAFRLAETERDLCYAQRGYDVVESPSIPREVVDQCTRSILTYEEGSTMRMVKAGGIGLGAALIFLLVAWFALFRRRDTGGTPPPAG